MRSEEIFMFLSSDHTRERDMGDRRLLSVKAGTQITEKIRSLGLRYLRLHVFPVSFFLLFKKSTPGYLIHLLSLCTYSRTKTKFVKMNEKTLVDILNFEITLLILATYLHSSWNLLGTKQYFFWCLSSTKFMHRTVPLIAGCLPSWDFCKLHPLKQ